MKKPWTAILLLLLLVVLLAGGGILYKSMIAHNVRNGENEERAEPVERHRRENADDTANLILEGQEEVPAQTAEASAAAAEETPFVLSEEPAADFSVLNENGETVRLSDSFGKPIIVNFWATWCPPCRMELPAFDAAYEAYGDRICFMMVDLTDGTTDTVESATAFIREDCGYRFPLYYDVEYSGADAYRINAIPLTLFIRADGSILYQQVGALDEATLNEYMQQLLD